MSRLHICNTFFEKELEGKPKRSLIEWQKSHPVIEQLQFLPLLYAKKEDLILVSDLPENPDPRFCLIPPKGSRVEDWGPSLTLFEYANEHQLNYSIPEWPLVQKINSKVFSFIESPKLPRAKLLESQGEIVDWIESFEGPKILKTPFGTAGSGHRKASVKQLYKTPIIGEPWVERVVDFSSQWLNGKLVGITLFENEPNGTYKRTYVGDVETWALDEHLKVAKKLIEKIIAMGYSGHIGIDAFVYLWKSEKRVHPVVEINARKTMSGLEVRYLLCRFDRELGGWTHRLWLW